MIANRQSERIGELRAETERKFAAAETAVNVNQDLNEAEVILTDVIATLEVEPDLSQLYDDAKSRLATVTKAIAAEDAKQAAGIKFFEFQKSTDQARFYGSLFRGESVDQDLHEAKKHAESALAAYGLTKDGALDTRPDAAAAIQELIESVANPDNDATEQAQQLGAVVGQIMQLILQADAGGQGFLRSMVQTLNLPMAAQFLSSDWFDADGVSEVASDLFWSTSGAQIIDFLIDFGGIINEMVPDETGEESGDDSARKDNVIPDDDTQVASVDQYEQKRTEPETRDDEQTAAGSTEESAKTPTASTATVGETATPAQPEPTAVVVE